MGKSLPISALITGLLAGSALGVPPALVRPERAEIVAEAFPAAMPVELEREIEKLARGETLNAYGMQNLRRKLAREMQGKLVKMPPAQGGAANAAAPVRSAQTPVTERVAPPGHTEKAAFLGIAATAPSPLVRSQLNLSRGTGLVVDRVEKDSPAAAAGVQSNDILQKLDDQLLINAQQLAVLVRSKKPGDEVKLTLLRAGKPTTLTAKLVEKEVPVLEELQEPRLSAIVPDAVEVDPEVVRKVRVIEDPASQTTQGATATMKSTRSILATRQDDKYQITLTSDDGVKFHVVAKDLSGQPAYEGGADGDADFKAMPGDVAERVKAMLEKIK